MRSVHNAGDQACGLGSDNADSSRGDADTGPGGRPRQHREPKQEKKKLADYILSKEPGVPIAVVEAKDNSHTVSQGLQQALGYAEILDIPSAFSSNGDLFASHNKVPAADADIETQFALEAFPGPGELWQQRRAPSLSSVHLNTR